MGNTTIVILGSDHPKVVDLDRRLPLPEDAIHGCLLWRSEPAGQFSDNAYQRIRREAGNVKKLGDLTELYIEETRIAFTEGSGIAFTAGVLTSMGNKLVNWAILDTTTHMLQSQIRSDVVSTTAIPQSLELTLGANHSQEEFAKHWDDVVCQLGYFAKTTGKSGYLFVATNGTASYGARREILTAYKVNAEARTAFLQEPIILVNHANLVPDHSLRVVEKVDSLVGELEPLRYTHPHFTKLVELELDSAKEFLRRFESIDDMFSRRLKTYIENEQAESRILQSANPELLAQMGLSPEARKRASDRIEEIKKHMTFEEIFELHRN